MSRTAPQSDDLGFTLLELLIVIAILSGTTAAAAFLTTGANDRLVVAALADRTERQLVRTAQHALRTGTDQAATISPRAIVSVAGTTAMDAATALRWTTAKEASADTETPAIIFFGTGGASGGELEITRGRSSATIRVGWLDGRISRAR